MTEPLFYDCLTDAQCWSLFDAGVLHDCMVPMEVYQRLERLAPDHGCYLFAWPEGAGVPSLSDIIPGVAVPVEEPLTQSHHSGLENHLTVESIRLAIAAFCERRLTDTPAEGGRIYVVSTNPRPELRAGPCLEPRPRDLTAMSLPELEAYLDAVLRLEASTAVDSAASSARK
jgi:hypothetical protein